MAGLRNRALGFLDGVALLLVFGCLAFALQATCGRKAEARRDAAAARRDALEREVEIRRARIAEKQVEASSLENDPQTVEGRLRSEGYRKAGEKALR